MGERAPRLHPLFPPVWRVYFWGWGEGGRGRKRMVEAGNCNSDMVYDLKKLRQKTKERNELLSTHTTLWLLHAPYMLCTTLWSIVVKDEWGKSPLGKEKVFQSIEDDHKRTFVRFNHYEINLAQSGYRSTLLFSPMSTIPLITNPLPIPKKQNPSISISKISFAVISSTMKRYFPNR